MSQSYDALNRITSETFPDEPTQPVQYTYNTAGWLSSIVGYINSISYNARGQKTGLTYANGVVSTLTYDDTDATPTFRLQRRQTTLGGAPHAVSALTGWVKSWSTSESLNLLYRGGICVSDGSGACIGGDSTLQSGVGSLIGYIKPASDAGTVPVYQSTCYSNTSGVCTGWGLSLDVNGSAVGYLSTSAPDAQSANNPFVQSNGLLLQGLSGTASAYLWTDQNPTVNHTDHFYSPGGSPPAGYSSEGTTGYVEQTSGSGTVPLYRYVNATTGHHYYSTAADQPAGFSLEATLGYIPTTSGFGLAALYRHYNSTTGDYILDTSSTPPSGYVLQATLGYIYTSGTPVGTYQNLTYTYDNVGNILSITDTLWTGGRSFEYDNLNRLVEAHGTFGPNQTEVNCTPNNPISYNAIGDILNKCGIQYFYENPNHPSAVTRTFDPSTSTEKTYTYDANGNMTQANLPTGTRTFTWDADNRVDSLTAQAGMVDMAYDYTGIRVMKGGTFYPFKGYEIASDGSITKYFRIGNEIIAANQGGAKYFYHNDHLGGINVITDIYGGLEQLNEYDPWGKVSKSEGNADPTHRFTGQELDPESGLYYYGGRYYDQELGRFISADPFVPKPGNPQSLNRYSYVINNPVILIDPTGHFFWIPFIDFAFIFQAMANAIIGITIEQVVAGAMIGAAFGAIVSHGDPGAIFVGAISGGIAGAVGSPLFSPLKGGFIGHLGVRAVTGAVIGGLQTTISGGNFWDGAAQGALSAIRVAAIFGGYQLLNQLVSPSVEAAQANPQSGPEVANINDALRGLQFAAAEQSSVVSDAPRYAASDAVQAQSGVGLGQLYEKTIGQLDKAFAVVSVATAGVASLTLGGYLLAISPSTGPAALIIAAKGLTFLGSGAFLLNEAWAIAVHLSPQPAQVPVPRQ